MKKLITGMCILITCTIYCQKPVLSIFGGVSNKYQINSGIEAGVAQLGTERLTLLGSAQYNYSGGLTYSMSANFAHWLDNEKEAFVAPVVGLFQLPYVGTDGKEYRPLIPCFGVRYQVYGGFVQLQTNFSYAGIQVGYMFGNVKN